MLKQTLSRLAILLLVTSSFAIAQVGQFVDAPQFATGVNPQAVASGDFNGDGKLDLVVVNSASTANSISVLLSNGDGTFKSQVTYSTGTAPQGVAVGDFDNDGKLDVAVTNSSSNTVSIFMGNGDGTFRQLAVHDFATGVQPWGVAVGDFNKDGNLDLVVTNAHDDTLSILLGKGDGTFNPQAGLNPRTAFNPVAVVVVDLDNDGFLDLAVACNSNLSPNPSVISVLRGKGDGTFQSQLPFPTGKNPNAIVAADFNGDGFPDLAVANQTDNTVSVLLGNGKSGVSWNLLASVNYATAGFPTGVAAGDFNGDGHIDLAISNANGNSVSVLLGIGDGTFQAQTGYGTGNIPHAVIAAKFTSSNNTDLVVANWGANSVSAILGNGNGTFQTRIDYAAGLNPYSVATGDFNADGILDLAVAASNNNCIAPPTCAPGSLSIALGNGDGSFQTPVEYTTGTATFPRAVAVGAFVTGSKVLDVVVANYSTNTVGVFLGNGDGTFDGHVDYPVQKQPASVAVADLDGDGNLDIVVTNFNSNTVSVLLGKGDGTFKSSVPYGVGTNPISVATTDFNGDKKLDLVVVNEKDNNVSILLGNGDGTFVLQGASPTVGGDPKAVVVGDFNGDGFKDVAVADFNSQQVSVLLGKGDGTFQTAVPYATGANPWSIVAGDFNGDGITDLAVTSTPLNLSPGNLVGLLLGKGDGTFSTPSISLFPTGYQAYSAVVGDFNGDGAPDLAVANGNSNTVSILVNAQGTKMTLQTSGSPSMSGANVTFTASVSASVAESGTPAGTVTIKSGSTVIGSGALAAGQFAASTTTLAVGTDTISATFQPSDANFQTHMVSITQKVTAAPPPPDFTIAAGGLNPPTVTPPGTAASTITITPLNGLDPTTVTLSCSITPAASKPATCSFGAMSVAGGVGSVSMTINTVGPTAALDMPTGLHPRSGGMLALGLVIPAMLLGSASMGKQNRRKMLGVCLVFMLMSGLVFQMACSSGGNGGNGGGGGGGGTPGTPAGQYTVTVTGTATGGLQHSAPAMTLTVQ